MIDETTPEYTRFASLLKRVLGVPKSEIDRRQVVERMAREVKKKSGVSLTRRSPLSAFHDVDESSKGRQHS